MAVKIGKSVEVSKTTISMKFSFSVYPNKLNEIGSFFSYEAHLVRCLDHPNPEVKICVLKFCHSVASSESDVAKALILQQERYQSFVKLAVLFRLNHLKNIVRFFFRSVEWMTYEEHVLFVSNQIYYWIYKCTTCHYYTNIIKTI